MSKYKGHTPEPWEVITGELDGGYLGVANNEVERMICRVSPIDDVDPIDKANAAIIADAPKLARENEELSARLDKAQSVWVSEANAAHTKNRRLRAELAELKDANVPDSKRKMLPKSPEGYLRSRAQRVRNYPTIHNALAQWLNEAANEVETLRAECERLRDAMGAVWDYLQKHSPWSTSNDMEWADEIICGIDQLLANRTDKKWPLFAGNGVYVCPVCGWEGSKDHYDAHECIRDDARAALASTEPEVKEDGDG